MTDPGTRARAIVADPDTLRKIRERGFAIVAGVLDPQAVSVMKQELQRTIDEDLAAWEGREYPDAWMVHNLMVRHAIFARFLENPVMHAYLSPLLGDTCILYAYTSSSMPPSGANFSHRVHVDSPRVIPGYWTNVGVMVALDDYTSENGATRFLPGSFERVEPPSVEEFLDAQRRDVPKGGTGRDLQCPHMAHGWYEQDEPATSRNHVERLPLVHAPAVRLSETRGTKRPWLISGTRADVSSASTSACPSHSISTTFPKRIVSTKPVRVDRTMDRRGSVSVIVPVYRNESSLEELVARLVRCLVGLGRAFEIVLIDDGSPDRSWETILSLRDSTPR